MWLSFIWFVHHDRLSAEGIRLCPGVMLRSGVVTDGSTGVSVSSNDLLYIANHELTGPQHFTFVIISPLTKDIRVSLHMHC